MDGAFSPDFTVRTLLSRTSSVKNRSRANYRLVPLLIAPDKQNPNRPMLKSSQSYHKIKAIEDDSTQNSDNPGTSPTNQQSDNSNGKPSDTPSIEELVRSPSSTRESEKNCIISWHGIGLTSFTWCYYFLRYNSNFSSVISKIRAQLQNETADVRINSTALGALSPHIYLKKTMKSLHITDCILKDIPYEMKPIFAHLQKLTIEQNRFIVFPSLLCELSNLQYLYLLRNGMKIIPEGIVQKLKLKELSLDGNKLSEIDELTNISSLEMLSVQSNRIMRIPLSLSLLSHLKHLKLSNNKICQLPPSLPKMMTGLKFLDISSNNLAYLPNLEGWSQLKSLYCQ